MANRVILTKRENYWPDNHEGHQKAALLGWSRRRGTTPSREMVILTPTQTKYLGHLRVQVEEGQAGYRRPKEGGTSEWFGVGSTYPDWMKNQGWTRDEVLRVFDLMESGKGFGVRSTKQVHIADTIKEELAKVVRQESHDRKRWGGGKRTGKKTSAGTRGYRGRGVQVREFPAWVIENPGARLPKFKSLSALSNWIRGRGDVYGGLNAFYSSLEYGELYPEIKNQWTALKNKDRRANGN